MFALVDCNNFYISCWRVFNPLLENKPVVVLSNNDGCIISRSAEAKALGLKMAEPIFKRREFIKQNNVTVFSSNYVLYGDLSNRMMTTLHRFSNEVEVYSIDEAFVNLQGIHCNLAEYGMLIKKTIRQNIGIPVGVGIAPTKTLAKVANKIAKKQDGVFVIDSARVRDWAIRNTSVEDIWGIGRQYAKKLNNIGVYTGYDFVLLDSNWIRKNLSVVGLRVKEELLNRSCISMEMNIQPKQNIATTRAFGKKLTDFDAIGEAVSTHAVRCAEKLRRQKSVANFVTVFIHTDPFSEKERYVSNSVTVTLSMPSNSNNEIVVAAIQGLKLIYRQGLLYKKAGVIVSGISNDACIQGNLFIGESNKNFKKLSTVTDQLNSQFGKDMVRLAVQGFSKDWHLRQENLSPCYTTRWSDLLKVKA